MEAYIYTTQITLDTYFITPKETFTYRFQKIIWIFLSALEVKLSQTDNKLKLIFNFWIYGII